MDLPFLLGLFWFSYGFLGYGVYSKEGNSHDSVFCAKDLSAPSVTTSFENRNVGGSGLNWVTAQHVNGLSRPNNTRSQTHSNNSTSAFFHYVDMSEENVPIGSKARLVGNITKPDVEAVCITFQYAVVSNGPDKYPAVSNVEIPSLITLYNRKEEEDSQRIQEGFIGRVHIDHTDGNWKRVQFSACVWNTSQIVFETKKGNSSRIVAIGDVMVTPSKMACYCAKKYHGLPACHFNIGWCGSYDRQNNTRASQGWIRVRHLPDSKTGEGAARDSTLKLKLDNPKDHFVIQYLVNSTLKGKILGENITEVCIILDYATTGNSSQTLHIYNTVTRGDKETNYFLGSLTDETRGEWRTAKFTATVVPNGASDFILSEVSFKPMPSTNDGLIALDNIRVSERDNYYEHTTTTVTTNTTTSSATTTATAGTTTSTPKEAILPRTSNQFIYNTTLPYVERGTNDPESSKSWTTHLESQWIVAIAASSFCVLLLSLCGMWAVCKSYRKRSNGERNELAERHKHDDRHERVEERSQPVPVNDIRDSCYTVPFNDLDGTLDSDAEYLAPVDIDRFCEQHRGSNPSAIVFYNNAMNADEKDDIGNAMMY